MSTEATAKRLLVIDDMVDICALVASVAERCDFEVKTTVDPAAFREIYRAFRPDVVILDLAIPDSDGIDLLHFLVEENCTAKVLIMPAVHSASISTKLLQQMSNASVMGPMLVGLEKSVQIAPLGARMSEIYNAAVIAAYDINR